MYKTISDGRQYASFYVPISCDAGDPALLGYEYGHGYMHDFAIFNTWLGSFVIKTPPIAVTECIGISNFDTEKPAHDPFRTYKPISLKYDSGRDAMYNQRGLSRRNPNAMRGIVEKEKGVIHSRYEGTIYDVADGEKTYEEFATTLPPLFYVSTLLTGIKDSMYSSNTHASYGFTYSGISDQGKLGFDIVRMTNTGLDGVNNRSGFNFEVTEYLDGLSRAIDHYGPVGYEIYRAGYHRHLVLWSNLSYQYTVVDNEINLLINYTFNHKRGNWPYNGQETYDVNTHIKLWWHPVYGSNSIYDVNMVDDEFFHLDCTTEAVQTDSGYNPYGDPPVNWGIGYFLAGKPMIAENFPNTADGVSFFDSFKRGDTVNSLYRTNVAEKIFRDIYPSIHPSQFLAFSDAVENQLLVLQSNSIQNLQHLKDILDLAPDVPELLNILARIFRGDVGAIVELIDYLTETVLKVNFGINPLTRDVTEITSQDVLKKVQALTYTESFTGYGEFFYQFSDEENPFADGHCFLRTRYKGGFTVNSGTLMMAVLASNSLGLLPTLSRVWEILPFSFVVDWVLNMKQRIKQIDNLALSKLCLVSEWNLTSFKLLYVPSDELLASYNLRSSPEDPFTISVYERDLSLYAPSLVGSHFDFLRAVRSPNMVTVGSLIWQLR